MPFKDPEADREYRRRRYHEHREAELERARRKHRERAEAERAYRVRRREDDPDAVREAEREWKRLYRLEHPEVDRAHLAVSSATRAGTLVRESCLFCDAPKTQAHHHDYSQPLVVTWLCPRHHKLAHR